MDAAKRCSMRFVEGPGGLKCRCCGALGWRGSPKVKPLLRRAVRRAMKRELAKEVEVAESA